MKIYTKTGDDGTTGLFGGDRVPKHHLRIETYGTVDELNAVLGIAAASLDGHPRQEEAAPLIRRLQNELFEVGADLATPMDAKPSVPRITPPHIEQMERDIDRLEAELPALRQFILPGGGQAGASLHHARTVCRRAERLCVALGEQEPVNLSVSIYLNRLSDLLFSLARWINFTAGEPETPWETSI